MGFIGKSTFGYIPAAINAYRSLNRWVHWRVHFQAHVGIYFCLHVLESIGVKNGLSWGVCASVRAPLLEGGGGRTVESVVILLSEDGEAREP